jgi:hypothetical protein
LGADGDIPVSGDFDGDGTTDTAIFRGSTGLWAIQDVTRVYFGNDGDISVSGLAINPSTSKKSE